MTLFVPEMYFFKKIKDPQVKVNHTIDKLNYYLACYKKDSFQYWESCIQNIRHEKGVLEVYEAEWRNLFCLRRQNISLTQTPFRPGGGPPGPVCDFRFRFEHVQPLG